MANQDQCKSMEGSSETKQPPNVSRGSTSIADFLLLVALRLLLIATGVYCWLHADELQYIVNSLWKYLTKTWVYNSVYFETWFVTLVYALLTIIPLTMDKIRWFDRFKIDHTVKYSHTTVLDMVKDAIIYVSPLMLLDTVITKKYPGVNPEIIREKRNFWIQKTRGLPSNPPLVGDLFFQLTASILLFDAIFFFIHFALHRNNFLYKHIHRYHHVHESVYCHVTNQLTIPERLMLILSANHALKVFNSHPLTRTVFIPVFIWILVDNHTGYDLPWGLHRIIPFGIYGGPVNHFLHHEKKNKHYQPFLTYLDKLLNIKKSFSNEKRKEL